MDRNLKRWLSVVFITFNEEKRILKTIKAIDEIADEIIVIDSFSTDKTLDIIKENIDSKKIIIRQREFSWFASQVNFWLDLVSYDWSLYLDADEVFTQELAKEVKELVNANLSNFDWYWIPFKSRILDYTLEIWDKYLRLFKSWTTHLEWEIFPKIVCSWKTSILNWYLIHESWIDYDFWIERKLNKYTTRRANIETEKKQFSKAEIFLKIIFFPLLYFFYYYFYKLRFKYWFSWFITALTDSSSHIFRYAKIYEKQYILNKRNEKN